MIQPNRQRIWSLKYNELMGTLDRCEFPSDQAMENDAAWQAAKYTEEYLDEWGDYMHEQARDARYGL